MLTTGRREVLLKASNRVQFLPLKSTWNVTVGIPAREGRLGGSGSCPGQECRELTAAPGVAGPCGHSLRMN